MEVSEHGQVTLLLIRACIPEATKSTTQSSVDSIEGKKVGGHKARVAFISVCAWMSPYVKRRTTASLPTPAFLVFPQMDSIPCHWGNEANQTHRDEKFTVWS